MTAACLPYRRPNLLPLVILAIIAALGVGVIWHMHAQATHGTDALDVRCSMNYSGPQVTWKMGDIWYFGCLMRNNKWGLQVARHGAEGLWHEVTSFVKGNGTWDELYRYMQRVGATMIENPELFIR